MSTRTVGLFVIVILFLPVLSSTVSVESAAPIVLFVGPGEAYTSIQAAINAASEGDTIIVRDGTYHENVVVNRSLVVRSENGPANCTVHAADPSNHVFTVTKSEVAIAGFTVGGASYAERAGIFVGPIGGYYDLYGCIISNNSIVNSSYGILLSRPINNGIVNNTVMNNSIGIYLQSSTTNTILNNTVSGNAIGFYLNASSTNRLEFNTVADNEEGVILFYSNSVELLSNHITHNGLGIGLISSSWNRLSGNRVACYYTGICLNSSSNRNTILNNAIYSNGENGIALSSSSNNSILGNTVSENGNDGICLSIRSRNNTVSGNTVSYNPVGICVTAFSDGNSFTTNDLVNNNDTAKDISINTWFNNYFSDYAGQDQDGNGLGDVPYLVQGGGNRDLRPRMHYVLTPNQAPVTVYVPDDYQTIQYAVNYVPPGSTIIVRDGTYHENILINKRATIRSQNGPANCTVGGAEWEGLFRITASNVTLSGFTVRPISHDSTSMLDRVGSTLIIPAEGILISGAQDCSVSHNIVLGNIYGIYLEHANNISLLHNNISYNWYGLTLADSSNNTISYNVLLSNTYHDLGVIDSSKHNVITFNSLIRGNDSEPGHVFDQCNNTWDYNFYSEYNGTDANGDGIGDIPFFIPSGSNVDMHPRMSQEISSSVDYTIYIIGGAVAVAVIAALLFTSRRIWGVPARTHHPLRLSSLDS